MRNNVARVYGSVMCVVSLFACQYFFQSLMNASALVRLPENMNGELPINLSPVVFAPCCGAAGIPGLPPPPGLPPLPPPPLPGGTPPGNPGFPPPGVLVDWTGNPCPANGWCWGSGWLGWRVQNVAMSSLVYMWPVRGLIVPALMACVVVCTSVIGMLSI